MVTREEAHDGRRLGGGIGITSLDERVPELLGQDAAVVLDVDGLEDAIELELLVVHVPPEVVIADAAVAVPVAGAEQGARVVLGACAAPLRNAQRGEAGLDLRVVEVAPTRRVEEAEDAADPHLPLRLRLAQRQQHALERRPALASPSPRRRLLRLGNSRGRRGGARGCSRR
jgi:hypothetical protein